MKYIKIARLGLKKVFIYRGSILLILFARVISIFILQKFWYALYGQNQSQYFYMLNYAIISQILGIIYQFNSPSTLAGRIRTGAISIELLRPWEYINALLFQDLGTIVGNLMSSGMVLFVTAKLLFDLTIPSVKNFILFFVSALFGFMVLFLIKTLVAMICFWIVEASTFLVLTSVVVDLLSGQFLPTWLVPTWMEKLMNMLPFVWIYQKPISVYLGAAGDGSIVENELYQILLLQLVWIIVLYVFVLWVWRKAVNKLSVQGG